MNIEYIGLSALEKHFVTLGGMSSCFIGEHAVISCADGTKRNGRVVSFDGSSAKIEVFEGTQGLSLDSTRTQLTSRPFSLALSEEMLGRCFDGCRRAVDGLGDVFPEAVSCVEKGAIELNSRDIPGSELTDGFLLGQSKALFCENEDCCGYVLDTVRKAAEREKFAMVFASVGNDTDIAQRIKRGIEDIDMSSRSVMFICSEDSSPSEWTLAPLCAMSTAEYLAFECGYDVLAVMTDMSAYSEASRELARGRGYSVDALSDSALLECELASIFNRAGIQKDKSGSVSLLAVFSSSERSLCDCAEVI